MVYSYLNGLALGLSFIFAIGSQNAFVLRQGLRGEHVLAVILVCAVSDAIFVSAGVLGIGAIVRAFPDLITWLTWGGAAFLIFYGIMSFRRALRSNEALNPYEAERASLIPTLATAFVLTWMNPHVYLDTVVLLGSISTTHGENAKIFGAGAVTASFLFFFILGYGARILRPLFSHPMSWRILDGLVGVTMFLIAFSLLSH